MCIETIRFTIRKESQYDILSLSQSVCNTLTMLLSVIPVESWHEQSSSYASAIEKELHVDLLVIKRIITESWCPQIELGSDFCFWSRNQFGCDCFEIGFRIGVSVSCNSIENNLYIVFPKSFELVEQSPTIAIIKDIISSNWKIDGFNIFHW